MVKERIEAEYPGFFDLSLVRPGAPTKAPVTVICPFHGAFQSTPERLIYSTGCKKCKGFHPAGYYPKRRLLQGEKKPPTERPGRPSNPHTFYILEAVGVGLIKIGITSDDVEKRRVSIDRMSVHKMATVYTRTFYDRRLLLAVERVIKRAFPMGCGSPSEFYDGASEITFKHNIRGIINIVETVPQHPITRDG